MTEVLAGNLCDGGTVVSLADHAGEIIVYAAGKNGTECNPQEYNRTPEGALQGTEDRAKAGDVQQLHQKQLPPRHDNVVNAIVNANCRRFPVIRAKGFVYNFTISKIAGDQ